MHLTYDFSIGSILTLIVTLGGVLVAAGRMTALLTQTARALDAFKDVFQKHVDEDAKNFASMGSSIQSVAVKLAEVSATLAVIVNYGKPDKEQNG